MVVRELKETLRLKKKLPEYLVVKSGVLCFHFEHFDLSILRVDFVRYRLGIGIKDVVLRDLISGDTFGSKYEAEEVLSFLRRVCLDRLYQECGDVEIRLDSLKVEKSNLLNKLNRYRELSRLILSFDVPVEYGPADKNGGVSGE